jgi:hypothetical protein
MMSKNATILRNSLIVLALGAAVPATWADSSPPFSVAVHSAASPPVNHRTLDLTPPDIRDVMPADELNAALPNPDETEFVGEPETVQVQGAPPAPYIPGGFAALYWAATHPVSAWRILVPVQ